MSQSFVSVTDKHARVFFDAPQLSDYYDSVATLRPLLQNTQWNDSVTGFYLFRYQQVPHREPRPPLLRLTFFVSSEQQADRAFELTNSIPLKIWRTALPVREHLLKGKSDATEYRFRRFLCLATQIGLEVMETALVDAQQLYRNFQSGPSYSWGAHRDEFVQFVQQHSLSFRELSKEQKAGFIADTEFNATWSHNFVGVIVGDLPQDRKIRRQ